MQPTALILGYVWPEPNSSAAGARIVQLIESLQAGGYHVHFACAATPTDHQIDLAELQVTAHNIELNSSSFNEFVEALNPQLVIFDRFVTEEQFGWRVAHTCPDAMRVLDTEDLHSLRYAREMQLKQVLKEQGRSDPVLLAKPDLFTAMRRDDMILREVAAILRCDITLMISEFEIELLTDCFNVPNNLLLHLPFMIRPEPVASPTFAEREHFVTIGNFRHAPNWDAVLWLKQEIWPLLRKRCPEAQLHIYGAYPPKKATQLTNTKERFVVKGWAQEALPVIAKARVLLAPLRFGAGIKGKLVDAMQTATPSVVTSIAGESMAGQQPWPGLVADQLNDFVDAAEKLYQQQDLWQQASGRCHTLLHARYDFATLSGALLEKLNERLAGLAEFRRQNFLGAMFQYHSARSTEFMSRWIEAKSKTSNPV